MPSAPGSKVQSPSSPRLVSYAEDMASCTLNHEGREFYFDLVSKSDAPAPLKRDVALMERVLEQGIVLFSTMEASEARNNWLFQANMAVRSNLNGAPWVVPFSAKAHQDRQKSIQEVLRRGVSLMPLGTKVRSNWFLDAHALLNAPANDDQDICARLIEAEGQRDALTKDLEQSREALAQALQTIKELRGE